MHKILIIEDDPVVLRLYTKIFTYENFSVITTEGGEEGLVKAKSEKPDVIVLDIMMPQMNGIEVLKSLKANPETKEIPVIILTNLSNEFVLTEAYSLGASGYLIKSEVENSKIVEEVKKYLK